MSKLPGYFKEYLDERFDSVDETLDSINKHLETLNSKVAKNKDNIQKLGIALILMTPIYISDSRNILIDIIRSLF